jgi:beta-glucosidase
VPSNGKEAVDRKAITLEQEELVEQVYAANPRTIMVLISSFPYAINWSREHIPAILHMTHNSQELGNALADVLFGDVNPGGRLVHTWPKSEDQIPPLMDYNIQNGRTYMYFKGEPLYPFGYGLSYTTFKYSNLRISPSRLAKNGKADVQVDVQNVGKRDGDEVVQLYVSYPKSSIDRPRKELRGFKRVALKAGEKKVVSIPLDARRLASWDIKSSRFVVEPTTVTLQVGASSADIKLSQNISVE